ncbi:MAG: glycoside hydrolase family 127 protein [Anaerolineae bacterium]
MPQPLVHVVDTTNSPQAMLRPVDLTAVHLNDTLWAARREKLREVTLLSQWQQCSTTGRLFNFERAAGRKEGEFQGYFFNDSDVYKWVEAAAWWLATEPSEKLADKVNSTIEMIAAAQETDGYLNTYFTGDLAGERWTKLFSHHELYCAGHLIQAAVAHKRATGQDELLTVARRFADLICATFGNGPGQRQGTDGHPEIEIALVEFYRLTGEKKYLDQAEYFLEARGHGLLAGSDYCQDEVEVRKRTKLGGHAVRAIYLAAGAADLCLEKADPEMVGALDAMWTHMTTRQMYITGGVGSRHEGEAFGADYELPNDSAYCETCAAIASVMWNHRMLLLTGGTRYADLMEHALYNGVLPGIAVDGEHYFYVNPLTNDGSHRREPWFACACCPPNIARILATINSYMYAVKGNAIWVNLYGENEANITLADGRTINLTQHTRYPWDGDVEIVVGTSGTFGITLRMPEWCGRPVKVTLDGKSFTKVALHGSPGQYLTIDHDWVWEAGDKIRLSFPMDVRLVEAHPRVVDNVGKVALLRGPIVYCLEGVDNPNTNLDELVLSGIPSARMVPNLLGGVIVLQGSALKVPQASGGDDWLYRARPAPARQEVPITAIPYFAWANREPAPMRVWVRR